MVNNIHIISKQIRNAERFSKQQTFEVRIPTLFTFLHILCGNLVPQTISHVCGIPPFCHWHCIVDRLGKLEFISCGHTFRGHISMALGFYRTHDRVGNVLNLPKLVRTNFEFVKWQRITNSGPNVWYILVQSWNILVFMLECGTLAQETYKVN